MDGKCAEKHSWHSLADFQRGRRQLPMNQYKRGGGQTAADSNCFTESLICSKRASNATSKQERQTTKTGNSTGRRLFTRIPLYAQRKFVQDADVYHLYFFLPRNPSRGEFLFVIFIFTDTVQLLCLRKEQLVLSFGFEVKI